MRNLNIILIYIVILLLSAGCKNEFLDAKPSSKIIQPVTLEELQSLLDNFQNNTTIALGILGSDDYEYQNDELWRAAGTATERNSYIWAKDLFQGENFGDWDLPYRAILYSNNVLSGLDKINPENLNSNKWNETKGWALFTRANSFYNLVRNFAPAYDPNTSKVDLGIPLRLKPSIDEILPRSSVAETYERILLDLTEATKLLSPDLPENNRNRPSKISCHALLARIYLNMRDYKNAELHADSSLKLYNKLLDYNTVNTGRTYRMDIKNEQLIYNATSHGSYVAYATIANNTQTKVAADLISYYSPNDLRLLIYFVKQTDGTYDIKRGYLGNIGIAPFVGIANDEIYLIKAECAARRDDRVTALNYLTSLLVNGYVRGTFIPLEAITSVEALNMILLERRKELVSRALRWDDLKRLNKEGRNITLSRTVNGQTYTLSPNSPRYVFPIPDNEIRLSGIQQNQR